MMKKRVLTILLSLTVMATGMFFAPDRAEAAGASIQSVGVGYPIHLYEGKGFIVKGRVYSGIKLKKVRAGVKYLHGGWKWGYYKTVNPRKNAYNLNEMDYSIPIRKLPTGTYYYSVYAKNRYGVKKTVLQKKFTVSKIYSAGVSRPTTLKRGKGFVVKGVVRSTFKMKNVKVGVRSKSGNWVGGVNASRIPNSKSYSLSKVDSNLRFGKLRNGTYYYTVKGTDVYGKTKTVVNQRFRVTSTGTSSSGGSSGSANGILRRGGYQKSYKSWVINSIGKQPVSGPCGIYAMAYVRAVKDGYFSNPSFKWLKANYGHGSYAAHWYEAGGSSEYFSSAKSCYRKALGQLTCGRPCIVSVYNGYTGNQHYITLIGYTAGTTYSNVSLSRFIALDPAYGSKVYVSSMKYYDKSSPQLITF